MAQTYNNYTYIDSATTTQVYTGNCVLNKIIIGEDAAGAISIIDGTSGSTVNVLQFEASAPVGHYDFNIALRAGLRIITAAATKITVVWSV